MAGSQEALDRFERQSAWPMMALALAIIPLLVVSHSWWTCPLGPRPPSKAVTALKGGLA
jgi:hypothetical protein